MQVRREQCGLGGDFCQFFRVKKTVQISWRPQKNTRNFTGHMLTSLNFSVIFFSTQLASAVSISKKFPKSAPKCNTGQGGRK